MLVGLLAFAGSAATSLLVQMPQPRGHDEFSYLLGADTFAHGRLTNPPHPMWVHFESFHIIHQPTYASKYPPAQALALALGQVIGGHAVVGVWISSGLACATVYWMLLAWLPSAWALLGGLLAVATFGIAGYWSQSYWGGAVAVLGGALLFGALRRIVRRPQARHAALLGVSLAILANSRPFEGLLVSLPAAVVLVGWSLGRNAPPARVLLGRVILPILGVLLLAAGAMAYYNLRVTGSPFRTPYQVHEATYAREPLFLWQGPRPEPTFRHEVMRAFWDKHFRQFLRARSIAELPHQMYRKVYDLYRVPLGPFLLIPLLTLPWLWRNPWMILALVTVGVLTFGHLSHAWTLPHYAAPVTGLLLALVVEGLRHLRWWRWGSRRVGGSLVAMALVMAVLWPTGLIVRQRQWRESLEPTQGARPATDRTDLPGWLLDQARRLTRPIQLHRSDWFLQRARILDQLSRTEGRHLVIVRYGPEHDQNDEWTYNAADIDGAKVVWAREMDPARNCELLDYFRERHVWLIEADATRAALTPYPVPASGACPRGAP
jgi:hypothetical protein